MPSTLKLALAVALITPTALHAESRRMDDVKEPEKGTPLSAWTPAQQWGPSRDGQAFSTYGYNSAAAMLVFADEIGDKLAETARISMIDRCFEYAKGDSSDALRWAICGTDAKAVDLKKLDAQLAADGINEESRKDLLEEAKRIHAKAMKSGEAVEAAAKDDPGVAQLLKLAEAARTEWNAYLAKHKEAFERYLLLKDGVRSGKSNHKNFAGCWEKTQPAFVKLVKATKFPWELPGDYLPGYMAYMLSTPDSYITTAAFAACAYSVHESGEALIAAAVNQNGGVIKVGWRSLLLAKALDANLKPKFAERSLNLDDMRSSWRRDMVKMAGVNDIAPIMTPAQGTVATIKPEGDVAKITFKGNTVDACLEWKTTNRVSQVSPNGSVTYEKVCKKRGKVANQETATEVSTKFSAGIAPGVDVLIVYKFPVVAWKGKKFVSVFGVPVK